MSNPADNETIAMPAAPVADNTPLEPQTGAAPQEVASAFEPPVVEAPQIDPAQVTDPAIAGQMAAMAAQAQAELSQAAGLQQMGDAAPGMETAIPQEAMQSEPIEAAAPPQEATAGDAAVTDTVTMAADAPEVLHEEYMAPPAEPRADDIEEDMSNIRPVPRVSVQAFCETENVANIIDRASKDRRMAKAHCLVQTGGIPAAIDYYQTATTPNLIVLETNLIGTDLLGQLQALAEVCDEGTNVMIVGHHNDVALYRELMTRGVAEYLVAPISMSELMRIINTLFVNPEADPLGQSIAFVGAKGGVGSSTVAHNVAFSISSSFSSDVILADLDLAFGTANIDFDQDPAQGIAEAVFSSDRIDDTYLDRLLAKCSDHLSLLAAPSTLDRDYDFGPDDFRQVVEIAQRGTPNVVLDLPHLWTGWSRSVLASADKIVITAVPDLANLRNTKNLLDVLSEERPNDDKPFLVLNQCNIPKRPEIAVEDFTEPLGLEPAVIIPFEPALFGQASNNGQMIAEADPKNDIAASFETLAQIVTGRREIQSKKKGGSFLSGLFKKK